MTHDPDARQHRDAAARTVVEPRDAHNRRLVENVHPGSWVNPEPAERYNMVVVGGGTAGLVTAAASAGLGARVALVERGLLGGDCLNHGCVPSKALLRTARSVREVRDAARFGVATAPPRVDFAAVMERMRRLRADISGHDSAARFRDLGVDVFLGQATFTGEDALEVGGRTLRFRRACIATGARAAAPPIPGLEEAGYLTNETVFSLTELPRRLAVIGAGPIGCELAQAFARFGSEVVQLEMAPRILIRDDAACARVVAGALEADGVDVVLDAKVTAVESSGESRTVVADVGGEPRRYEVDAVLVAVGRAANVEGLGLDAARVAHDRGGVHVDDRLRTTNRRIFAAGDICTPLRFTHMADAMARIVVRNALFRGRARAGDLVVPWATYTDPELAHVGLTEDEAARRGVEIDTVEQRFADVDRAVLDGELEGLLRIHVRRGGDKIVGASLVAHHAGDLVGELAVAMKAGAGLGTLSATIHPYPTRAEIFRKAGDAWNRTRLTPAVKTWMERWFRWTR